MPRKGQTLKSGVKLAPPLMLPPTQQLAARRLAALLNAALGYVADSTGGFVDFDALPEQGASVQVRLRVY